MRQTSNGVRGLRAAGVAWLCAGLAGSGIAAAQGVDLIVGDITGSTAYVSAGSPKAYSLGLSYCNLGDTPANFDGATANHPIVTQNMYRLSNGRFEQIGQAWAAHLVAVALQQSLCSTCTPWADLSKLGAGCSSSDSASFLGTQANFGAKSEVNAAAGTFLWPRVNLGDPTTTTPAAFKRLQVNIADLQPGPLYFVSSMIVAADDAAAGNGLNNESYRRVTVGFAAPSEPLTMAGTTQRGVPAVRAWKDNGLGVGVPDPDVMLTSVDVPGDGRFWIASKATDLGGGYWHYEYAVENLNSNRAAHSFAVPLEPGTSYGNIEFHGVPYHSGEVYSNAAWTGGVQGASVVWETPSLDPDTSALRWDTIYNFRFDAPRSPVVGNASLVFLTSDPPGEIIAAAMVPAPESTCGSADFNCDGDVGTDADIEAFFGCLAGNCPAPPCLNNADFNGDGDVGTDADIEAFFRVLAGGTC